MLEVLEAGLLDTIQDFGRPEAAAWGVPRGGACDPWSLGVANALLGNKRDAPAVEITLTGPTLRARAACRVALAGADLAARLVEPDTPLTPGSSIQLEEGQTLAFGAASEQQGIRAYLTLPTGVDVPRVLGSASTCLVGGFGGLAGRRLAVGDLLARVDRTAAGFQQAADRPAGAGGPWKSAFRPEIEHGLRALRVLPGPHAGRLGERALQRLVTAEYRVSPRGDRQAIVLDGPAPASGERLGRLLSHGVTWGAIQLPPDGRPICLLADHQTVGGYPVLAVVITADLPALGQLGPGDSVRFRAVELAEASPGGLLMPNQALMYTGRVLACTQLPEMMHLVRDLCGCQLSLIPSAATFRKEGPGRWLEKYLRVGDRDADDRRKLFAYARDLVNSDYAGHRLTFQLFAQSPPFSHLLAVYNNYDFDSAMDLVLNQAGISEPVGRAA
jgi:biotin-dependent carboxylase-like uncharacterized protein